jgi:hypothetical protein
MFQESGTQNRDPRFDVNFPRPCDHKISLTAIAVTEIFIPEKCGKRGQNQNRDPPTEAIFTRRSIVQGESLYVSEPKRLRSSSGHGGDWRTGVDFQRAGSFTHSALRLSCPWGRDPWGTRNCFVSCPYSFPQHCMPYRLSVGAGLLQPFLVGNKNT